MRSRFYELPMEACKCLWSVLHIAGKREPLCLIYCISLFACLLSVSPSIEKELILIIPFCCTSHLENGCYRLIFRVREPGRFRHFVDSVLYNTSIIIPKSKRGKIRTKKGKTSGRIRATFKPVWSAMVCTFPLLRLLVPANARNNAMHPWGSKA